MAVDANVIIFERIREELRLGLASRQAVNLGYSRATLTILDANVTTVIAAMGVPVARLSAPTRMRAGRGFGIL